MRTQRLSKSKAAGKNVGKVLALYVLLVCFNEGSNIKKELLEDRSESVDLALNAKCFILPFVCKWKVVLIKTFMALGLEDGMTSGPFFLIFLAFIHMKGQPSKDCYRDFLSH